MNFDKFFINKMHSSKANLLADMTTGEISLDVLLEYELKASSRYRRYVSVILLKGVGSSASFVKSMVLDCIRTCDAAFAYGNYVAVLMGETDEKGSSLAIERYRKSLSSRNQNARFASVTFPADGITADDLGRVLWQRIEAAKTGSN